jgi:phage host-nuclease inhibitor protein Gam
MKVAIPRTNDQALELAKRFAAIGADVAMHEADRQERLAAIGADVDMKVAPLVEEAEAIRQALEPWWKKASPALLKGKRKSIEFGGCSIGTRSSAEKVEFALGDDKLALATLADQPFKSKVTETKRVLNKTAIAGLLRGKSAVGNALSALGFRIAGGEDAFFVKRIDSPDAKVSAQ